ncbi:MAG: hypothetical protein COB71_09360 [Thiotrichales bacterium]|nr:MAG: hypothetical protein COB71_12485 [Thiotrichales bacterium]PCI12335.1 MAG: hypothetical protein COB71_09360 [Thiotrichales bacterium]
MVNPANDEVIDLNETQDTLSIRVSRAVGLIYIIDENENLIFMGTSHNDSSNYPIDALSTAVSLVIMSPFIAMHVHDHHQVISEIRKLPELIELSIEIDNLISDKNTMIWVPYFTTHLESKYSSSLAATIRLINESNGANLQSNIANNTKLPYSAENKILKIDNQSNRKGGVEVTISGASKNSDSPQYKISLENKNSYRHVVYEKSGFSLNASSSSP